MREIPKPAGGDIKTLFAEYDALDEQETAASIKRIPVSRFVAIRLLG